MYNPLSKKAQSALEYMMTYGWAILIIVIVAVILYSMGIFNPSSSISATVTGFSGLGVTQASCVNSVNNQILELYVYNEVGYIVNLTEINVTGSNGVHVTQKVNSLLPAGKSAMFYINGACNKSSSSYSGSATITYTEPGQVLQGPYLSTGKILNIPIKADPNLIANFSGGPHYISLSKNAAANVSGSLSVAIWFKTSSYGAMIWVGNEPMPNNVGAWWNPLYVADNDSLFGGAAVGPIFETNHIVSNGGWYFAVFTINRATDNEMLYLNGSKIGVISTPGIVAVYPNNGAFQPYYWSIGGGSSNGGNWPDLPPKSYFNGSIANVQIYSGALSLTQVKTLYLEGIGGAPIPNAGLSAWYPLDGNANDYSGNNYNGVATNVQWVSP